MRTVLAALAVITATTMAEAQQTIGPGGVPMAPGPSQPRDFTPGGVGPGGAVAPGPAARGANIDREGPGGTRFAPGPAGSVGSGPTPPSQTVIPSGSLRPTIRAKGRTYRKSKRRPIAQQ
jgi:hypothetical protein